jgi:hypothetical protein
MDERPDAVLHASQTVSRYDLNIASIQGDPNNETSKDGMLMVKINNGMLKDGTARLCIAPVPSLNCGALREKKGCQYVCSWNTTVVHFLALHKQWYFTLQQLEI